MIVVRIHTYDDHAMLTSGAGINIEVKVHRMTLKERVSEQ